jgi:hypothetical protein
LALAAGNMGSWDFNLATGAWFWDEGQSHIFGVDHASFVPTSESVKKGLHPDDLEKELLTQQRVPFLFVTGYGQHSLDPRFGRVPVLQKPVVQDELAGALSRVLGQPSRTKAVVQPAVTG